MVGDHRDGEGAVGLGVDHRAKNERRTIVEQFLQAVIRIRVRRALPQLGHIDHVNARALHQEADVDAADVVSFGEIRRVVRIGLPGRHCVVVHLVGHGLQRGQVLHLFHADNFGRTQDVADRQRRLVQAVVERGGRKGHVADRRIVDRVEEALHVESGDREVRQRWLRDRSRGHRRRCRRERRLREDAVGAERVVDDAGDVRQSLACGHVEAGAAQRAAVDADAFRILIERRNRRGPPGVVEQFDARLAERPECPGDDGVEDAAGSRRRVRLADRSAGGSDCRERVDVYAHPFIALHLIENARGNRRDVDRRGERIAGGDERHRG